MGEGKWPRFKLSKTQKLLITLGLIVKGRRGVEDAKYGGKGDSIET